MKSYDFRLQNKIRMRHFEQQSAYNRKTGNKLIIMSSDILQGTCYVMVIMENIKACNESRICSVLLHIVKMQDEMLLVVKMQQDETVAFFHLLLSFIRSTLFSSGIPATIWVIYTEVNFLVLLTGFHSYLANRHISSKVNPCIL